MAQKIKIDENICVGCGACEGASPQYFKVDDNLSHFLGEQNKDYSDEVLSEIQIGVSSCPFGAITLEEIKEDEA